MEQNMPVIAKKIWKIVRVAFFMLRKGMSKKKLLLDINMMKHRSKIAGKALFTHLIFHHHDTADATTAHGGDHQSEGGEYEFSCSSTPLYRQYLPKRKNHRHHVPITCSDYEDVGREVNFEAMSKALEMMVQNDVVRQLRVTDSPYPIRNPDPEDNRINQKAEEFIRTFYSQLRQQKF